MQADIWRMFGIRFFTACNVLGGAGSVVPKGALERHLAEVVQPVEQVGEAAPQSAVSGTVNGSCVGTLKGPLIPKPALAASSVK